MAPTLRRDRRYGARAAAGRHGRRVRSRAAALDDHRRAQRGGVATRPGNRGPVSVTRLPLRAPRRTGRAFERTAGAPRARYALRRGLLDPALENPSDPIDAWRFVPRFAPRICTTGPRPIPRLPAEVHAHAMRPRRAGRAVCAADRYEAVSREAQALIDRSRREPERVLRLERASVGPDLVLRGGIPRALPRREGGRARRSAARVLVEPLTKSVWDDIGFPGIARRRRRPLRAQQEAGEAHRAHPRRCRPTRVIGCSTPFWAAAPRLPSRSRWGGAGSASRRGAHVDALCLPRLPRRGRRRGRGRDAPEPSSGEEVEGFDVWT